MAAIGGGDIRLNQMVNFLQTKLNKPSAEEEDREALRQLTQKSYTPSARKESGRVVVEGVGNLMHHIAHCCQPIPGDDIVGFITQGRGISIHRADCDQLAELIAHAPERIVEAVWGESYSSGYSLVVHVTANDRSGLLRDITTILANERSMCWASLAAATRASSWPPSTWISKSTTAGAGPRAVAAQSGA
nr:GTP pyrophosphokinase [Candidatus Pantoea persica]